MNTNDDVLTLAEAAAFLKISTKTLRRMVLAGRLHPRRFGTRGQVWRFVRKELLGPEPTDVSVSIPNLTMPPLAALPSQGGRQLQRVKGGVRYR